MILNDIAHALSELYALERLPDVGEFYITQPMYDAYCAEQPHLNTTAREALIIEATPAATHVGLYIDPHIVATLTAHNPIHSLDHSNFDTACVAIEGVSHLLCAWWKLQREIPFTLLELELQAEIDKYLLCSSWIRQQGGSATLLLSQLFERYTLLGGMSASEAQRYHRASQLAFRYCDRTERLWHKHPPSPGRCPCRSTLLSTHALAKAPSARSSDTIIDIPDNSPPLDCTDYTLALGDLAIMKQSIMLNHIAHHG